MGKKHRQVELNDPTPPLVRDYIRKFEQLERYSLADQAIIKLIQQYPKNELVEDILLKACVINALYNTNVYAIVDMAQHIHRLQIDSELELHSPEIVNKIADFKVSGKNRTVISFASKYCNWHDKEHYPILDSHVQDLIIAYRYRDNFAIFEDDDLRSYSRFKEIIVAFRDYYHLNEFGFKQLDKFLWLYGKRMFP